MVFVALCWLAAVFTVATVASEDTLFDNFAADDECSEEVGSMDCSTNALQRRSRFLTHTDLEELKPDLDEVLPPPDLEDDHPDLQPTDGAHQGKLNPSNWQARVECRANPYSKPEDIAAAVTWVCGALASTFDCQSVPDQCKLNMYHNADFIFGTYYRQFGSREQDCMFNGTGILSDISGLSADHQVCVVKTHRNQKGRWLEMRACVGNPAAQESKVIEAISWACGQMQESECRDIPGECKGDSFKTADYVFGKYQQLKAATSDSFDCDFQGAGAWATSSELSSHQKECVRKVIKTSRSDFGEKIDKIKQVCRANRHANLAALHQAMLWACHAMPAFDCANGPPPQCADNAFHKADYIFGTYMNSLSTPAFSDCDFGGTAMLVKYGELRKEDQSCSISLEKTMKPREQASVPSPSPQSYGPLPHGPVTRPPPQTPNDLPRLDEASVSHYARFEPKDTAQLASGCMPSGFYRELKEHADEIRGNAPNVEGWYLAAAPIWMTQPMHGRNSASGVAGIDSETAWFDYKTGKSNLPNGPATGMMFDGGVPTDGYDTSDGCWEASWDDEHGKTHRVGMVVLDNCGHSDGVLNSVQNIKWCVPFQFTEEHKGATCPMDYFNKCFPRKQASHFDKEPYCQGDSEVIGKLRVTPNAPWAKMVIGTYEEAWAGHPYTSAFAAATNHTISWSGRGSSKFHSEGPCENKLLNLPPDQMPQLGSCSPNVRDTENRCRNAYGFPFHFDIATFTDQNGKQVEPPWGQRNTRVYGSARVTCPTGVKKAMLGSCGVPDMFIGNNLAWGSASSSYVPPHWCKETLDQCLADPEYRTASLAYLASTGHAFCHSEQCKRIHATLR